MSIPPATLQLQDVVTYVQRQFGDESGVQITTADITTWTNAGQRDIISKTRILKAIATTSTVINQQLYALPTNIIAIEAVQLGSQILRRVNMSEALGTLGVNSTATGGSNTGAYYWEYANNINIYPVPNSTTDSLIIYYASTPPELTSLSNLLSIPDRWFDVLTSYVLSKAYELDEDWSAHASQRSLYEQGVTGLQEADSDANGAFQVVTEVEYY